MLAFTMTLNREAKTHRGYRLEWVTMVEAKAVVEDAKVKKEKEKSGGKPEKRKGSVAAKTLSVVGAFDDMGVGETNADRDVSGDPPLTCKPRTRRFDRRSRRGGGGAAGGLVR